MPSFSTQFYYNCCLVAAHVYYSGKLRIDGLANALGISVRNRPEQQQLANILQQRLLGFAKKNGKYAMPDNAYWLIQALCQ